MNKYLRDPAARLTVAAGMFIGGLVLFLVLIACISTYNECRASGHSRTYCLFLIGG